MEKEPTRQEIEIKELSMAIYEQSKVIASKDREIERLKAKLDAINNILNPPAEQEKKPERNLWQENKGNFPPF